MLMGGFSQPGNAKFSLITDIFKALVNYSLTINKYINSNRYGV